MTPDVVIDVGNTRIKWGRCADRAIVATASLPPDDPVAWRHQCQEWQLGAEARYVFTGVHPERQQRLTDFLHHQGGEVRLVTEARELPLVVQLQRPDHVGIDRLFTAVAANSRREAWRGAVVIDAGSAVTVDWLTEEGAFAGGVIFPGVRLMALALHEHTALLPLIDTPQNLPALPGTSTRDAMAAGVAWAAAGGVRLVVERYLLQSCVPPHVFLTGGDGPLLQAALGTSVELWTDLTLEGIRLTAESLP
jgi:type III pantothenate kinase